MGWAIAAAVLLFLVFMPVGVCVSYGDAGYVWLKLGPARILLYPKDKKTKKQTADKKTNSSETKETETKLKNTFSDFFPIVKTVFELLLEYRKRVYLKTLEFNVVLANDDPSTLATTYGTAWATLGNLLPQLERFLCIKKREIEIQCDFSAEKTRIHFFADIRIPFGRFFFVSLRYGLRGLKQYLDIIKKSKAVQ